MEFEQNEILEENEAGASPSCEEIAENIEPSEPDELELLKTELENLKAELAEKAEREKLNERIYGEIEEFKKYFPDAPLESVPESVWESVKGGVPLSASFALYMRSAELERKKASDINEKNRKMSSGAVGLSGGERYFSPSEVKTMSPEDVRKNYDEILESMRHWN